MTPTPFIYYRRRGLQVDEVFSFGAHHQATKMVVVEDERRRGNEDAAAAAGDGNAD